MSTSCSSWFTFKSSFLEVRGSGFVSPSGGVCSVGSPASVTAPASASPVVEAASAGFASSFSGSIEGSVSCPSARSFASSSSPSTKRLSPSFQPSGRSGATSPSNDAVSLTTFFSSMFISPSCPRMVSVAYLQANRRSLSFFRSVCMTVIARTSRPAQELSSWRCLAD